MRQRRIAAGIATALFAALFFCAGASAEPKKRLPSHPIDLNRATLGQLEELPGVGPVMARSILRFRRLSGPFERVDDLLAIRGISRGRLDKIRPYVFVGKKKSRPVSPARPHGKPGPVAARG
ncbi:MAG TPA: helix-hairpin-helix domain-containing protein [Patescibacteria group bacterium]|nr:helix-hairpin-helix domain-containing protein [Patescibacteria group bacterium]